MKKSVIIYLCIVGLAILLRLYLLGQNPPSLDWDEASLGYNAYSILKTGKDEFGRSWPISIRSFEDYKPAVYTYLTVPAVALFGLTEFAVRLPSAIFGILTVSVCYFLSKRLFSQRVSLLVSLLLAISPWHLQFSRVAFEANVALFFVVLGVWFFLKGVKDGRWLLLSSLGFVISFYTYHSPRLVVPLLLLGWTYSYRKDLWRVRKWVIISIVCAFVFLIPFLREAATSGRARLGSVTVITPEGRLDESIKRIEYDQSKGDFFGKLLHNRRMVYGLAVAKGYLDHFNLDFLFLTGDAPDRHHARDMGMLYLWEAPFLLLGILVFLKENANRPLFWWFLVAPAASAITTGTPHAVRALTFLPTFQIFVAGGLIHLSKIIQKPSFFLRRLIYVAFFIVVFANMYFYLESYYIHSPVEAAKDWQFGYKEAVAVMESHENTVEKIIVTYRYDQPHIFVLFYERIDPQWYQSQWMGGEVLRDVRGFGKYEFRNLDWDTDSLRENVLLVGTSEEIPANAVGLLSEIKFPDGTVAFRIVKR